MSWLADFAETLDQAAVGARAVPQLTHARPDLTVEDAYAIQKLSIDRRLDRGERLVGIKMGLTSRAKMRQVGVDQMAWGRLTDAMMLDEGGSLSLANFIHPRIEPEIAFLMGAPLAGRVTMVEALAAVAAVAPAMEVIDSRYEDFKFALPDVIADNSSSSGFVIGGWNDPSQDLSNLGVILEIDGAVTEVGSSAAILGHPLRSLVAAAAMVSQGGGRIEEGDIVLAGGITAAPALHGGQAIRTTIENLGSVALRVQA
ncbi:MULTISPECIES: 2-keto-4-pentenoate hydratase [Sphingopyxis]|jgi:2-oxo-3-hexenedioate decarboxylase|uniref:2-keto-4-pentenoate hydratase n=1 Tax=Sphingopyxis TaxID=165697 RepID=UPI000735FA6E|nr:MULTISPECIES: fumarylacetoacetate hydrolase family protein [Sphingopyxis]KTE40408.1 4-oxalocrotonate decarboxylase [Sphingopyxis sp. HIX]KTE85096.1 4-oxalocrotonate decarboxylase [Sphingopyxis sp. HXXIV]